MCGIATITFGTVVTSGEAWRVTEKGQRKGDFTAQAMFFFFFLFQLSSNYTSALVCAKYCMINYLKLNSLF